MAKCSSKKGVRPASGDAAPEDIRVVTQITPDDIPAGRRNPQSDSVSEREVEEAVVAINPDVESMESRG